MRDLEELKDEISEIIASLKKYKTSAFFNKNIIELNLSLKDSFELKDFRFHSLLTINKQ